MENCLMCLEINRKTIDRIKVGSSKWRKQNIKNIIEQHFWTLKTLEPSEWICTTCWQELYGFHLFYSHVEEVHTNLVTMIVETDDDETTDVADQNYQYDKYKTNIMEADQTIETINTLIEIQKCEKDATEQIKDESSDDNVFINQQNELHDDSDIISEFQQNGQTKESNRDLKVQKEHDEFISANFQLSCDICHISLENFAELRVHYLATHNTLGYSTCCGKKMFSRALLVDHINVHLNPKYFKCQQCDKVLATRLVLETHMLTHKDYLVKTQTEYPYSCDTCGKSYKQYAKFETHKLTHEIVQEFPCSECGKICETKKKLYNHKRSHFAKYLRVCDVCGMTLHDRNTFITHMNGHENKKPNPVNCDICGLILANNRALRGHKRRQHPEDGIMEYPCHICSKISPNRRALRLHIRFAHEIDASYKCTQCDKVFKRREGLREHLGAHTGTPLYTCSWCPKTFMSKSNMNKHYKTGHTEQWEEARFQKFKEKYNVSAITNIQDKLE